MSERTIAFVRSLVERFPTLSSMFDEHVKDNGEILPHIFFGDLTRYVVSLLLSGAGVARRRELEDILRTLEKAYASVGDEDELQELISVSFLEHLPRPGDEGSEVRSMVGPRLSQQLKLIG